MSRYGAGVEGKAHPQKFWFAENLGEIPKNPSKEVSTSLFPKEWSTNLT